MFQVNTTRYSRSVCPFQAEPPPSTREAQKPRTVGSEKGLAHDEMTLGGDDGDSFR